MTFTVKVPGQNSGPHEVSTAKEAAQKIGEAFDATRMVKVHIDSEARSPGDLTPSERLIILEEGRKAAGEGRDVDASPYPDDPRRHALWLEGRATSDG